ncbi:hypothetical protein MC885_013463, partial [Smutsia gigantea]
VEGRRNVTPPGSGAPVAGLCSTVHCLLGNMLDGDNVTHEDQHNGMSIENLRLTFSNANFAFSLYKLLASKTPDKNVIFRPLSAGGTMFQRAAETAGQFTEDVKLLYASEAFSTNFQDPKAAERSSMTT